MPVHRFHFCPKLMLNRSPGPSARLHIPGQSPAKSHLCRTLNKDAQVKNPPQLWPVQQPQPVQQYQALWSQNLCLRPAGMMPEIILRQPGRAPCQAITQCLFQPVPVNRPRVIEINPRPKPGQEMRPVTIKIIKRYPGGLSAQHRLQFIRQPALACAASPHDGHQYGSVLCFHHGFILRDPDYAGEWSVLQILFRVSPQLRKLDGDGDL